MTLVTAPARSRVCRVYVEEIVIPAGWRDRLQDLGVTRRDAWLLASVAMGAALIAFFLWGRGERVTMAPPARPSPGISAMPQTALLVHVSGEVREPGLYEIPAGSRVADAIEAAGGATRAADVDLLNLAEEVVDAMKIEVPRRGSQPAAVPIAGPADPEGVLVDLNTADAAQLETLPGVGPVTAAAIIDHREDLGAFTSVEELLDIDGIGPATLEELRPHVTV